MQIRTLSHCRACSAPHPQAFLRLPDMPLTDDFVPRSRFGQEFRNDLDIFVCGACRTVQTQHNVDMGDYYEEYQYAVGDSPTASRFMHLLAGNLLSRYLRNVPGAKVLEIGSGDGGQLRAFQERGCRVLGYEPSAGLARVARVKGVATIQGLFGADSIALLPPEFRCVDAVVLSYTFDHLPQPREFLQAARSILHAEHGVLVVEVHDLQRILDRREYCLFEHEHSIYLTTATAQRLLAQEGLELLDFDLVPVEARRANSLLFVATPRGARRAGHGGGLRTALPPSYDQMAFYARQAASIRRAIGRLDAWVERQTDAGKRVAGYGAGGRGVMTLGAMATASRLHFLVDKKPKGVDLLVPKCGIPLVGVDELARTRVDEVIVFSFGYMAEIASDLGRMGYRPRQLHPLPRLLRSRARGTGPGRPEAEG